MNTITITDILRLANLHHIEEGLFKNPYLLDIEVPIDAKGKKTIDFSMDGRELVASIKSLVKENANFVKVYHNPGEGYTDWIVELPKAAQKVLLQGIFPALHYNALHVLIDPKILAEQLGMSLQSVYSGLKDLQSHNLIRKSEHEQYVYYINPKRFFRGEQVKALINEVMRFSNANTIFKGKLSKRIGK